MKKNIIFVIVALLVGAAGFYGGMTFSGRSLQANTLQGGNFSGQNTAVRQQRLQQMGMTGQVGRAQAGGMVNGEILSADDKSITVKLRDGGSKIVFFSASTEIGKFVTAAVTDLVSGKTVSVNGTANADGSVTAKTIQIRPKLPVMTTGAGGLPNGDSNNAGNANAGGNSSAVQ